MTDAVVKTNEQESKDNLAKHLPSGYMKKPPSSRMLRMTMIVMTMILTRLTAKSSGFRAKCGINWATKQSVF